MDSPSHTSSGSKWTAVVRRKWRGVVQTSGEAQRHIPKACLGSGAVAERRGIRFRTNSSTLAIRLEYPKPPNMANMHAFGQTGVDLYIDGVYRNTAIAGRDSKPGLTQEHSFYKDQPVGDRDITLYLPLYMPVKVLGIGVDASARV